MLLVSWRVCYIIPSQVILPYLNNSWLNSASASSPNTGLEVKIQNFYPMWVQIQVMLSLLYINIYIYIYIYGKVRCSRYRPGVAQKVGRSIALIFHDCPTIRGWVVSSTPWLYFTPGKDLVTIVQEARWAPGLVRTGRKSCPHRDLIPDRPAESQLLYRMS